MKEEWTSNITRIALFLFLLLIFLLFSSTILFVFKFFFRIFKKKENYEINSINNSLKNQEELLKLRLENLKQQVERNNNKIDEISKILLAPIKRGRLGNLQLDKILSLYLPKDNKIYQLEYRLKKPTGKGGFLITDAIIFGVQKKNNIAIDSKFPLENFLLANKEELSEIEKKKARKDFENDIKNHIKKVSEYISELDDIKHVIMFIPSEAVFSEITSFQELLEYALDKKVSICSPINLSIIINQILWAVKTYEQYNKMDQTLIELKIFLEEFRKFNERWVKTKDYFSKLNKSLEEFDNSVEKIVKKGEKLI